MEKNPNKIEARKGGSVTNNLPQEFEGMDVVVCLNCDFAGLVNCGSDRCPSCNTKGHLTWANEVSLEGRNCGCGQMLDTECVIHDTLPRAGKKRNG